MPLNLGVLTQRSTADAVRSTIYCLFVSPCHHSGLEIKQVVIKVQNFSFNLRGFTKKNALIV